MDRRVWVRGLPCLGVLLCAGLLAGCGAGGDGAAVTSAGPLVLDYRVTWPTADTDPAYAGVDQVRISLAEGGQALADQAITRTGSEPYTDATVTLDLEHVSSALLADGPSVASALTTAASPFDLAQTLNLLQSGNPLALYTDPPRQVCGQFDTAGDTPHPATRFSLAPVSTYSIVTPSALAGPIGFYARVGVPQTLSAVALDGQGVRTLSLPEGLAWSVSDPSVATVVGSSPLSRDTTAVVTFLKAGQVRVAVGDATGKKAEIFVNVEPPFNSDSLFDGTWFGSITDTNFDPPQVSTITYTFVTVGNVVQVTYQGDKYGTGTYEAQLVAPGEWTYATQDTAIVGADGVLTINSPTTKQTAVLRAVEDQVSLSYCVIETRRTPAGAVELDLIVGNGGKSRVPQVALVGVQLRSLATSQVFAMAGTSSGSSPYGYGANFGNLAAGQYVRRTLPFSPSVPPDTYDLRFDTQTGRGPFPNAVQRAIIP